MKSQYKLLVVDIDGTLVSVDGRISTENHNALTEARAKGIQVALSTGRGISASMRIIDQLALDSYHIFFDGALVFSPHQNQEVYGQPINKEVVGEMIEYTHRHNIDLDLYTTTQYLAEGENWSTQSHREFFGVAPHIVNFAEILETERIIKGGLVTRNPEEVARAQDFARHFERCLHLSWARTPAYPGIDFINVLTTGVSKGKALEALAAYLDIALDEVMGIGDGTNDVSLLDRVGLAVAMGNARDEAKAAADYITLDVDHHGLAAAIKRFLM